MKGTTSVIAGATVGSLLLIVVIVVLVFITLYFFMKKSKIKTKSFCLTANDAYTAARNTRDTALQCSRGNDVTTEANAAYSSSLNVTLKASDALEAMSYRRLQDRVADRQESDEGSYSTSVSMSRNVAYQPPPVFSHI